MCRIFGFWGRSKEILDRMQEPLKPGGPDHYGVYMDEKISLGHRRLSILDLTSASNQPYHFDNLVMSYNGEVYNFEQIKSELKEYDFSTHSDTEVIIKAFHKWGLDALDRFRGMFAIALWDRKKLWLIRDRMGVKPLYYYYDGKNFIFASEIKALLEHPGFKKRIDLRAASLYLQLGYVPAPYTIYENCYKLEPATILEFDGKAISVRRYWEPRPKDHGDLEELLMESFRLRMVADVDVGVFLSGGVDSSLVAAMLSRSHKLQTFTIGFEDPKYDEAPIAREVAKAIGSEHHERYFGIKELLDLIPKMIEVYDEPFGDSSALPTLLLSSFTKKHVKVALSADGADELFWGYPINFKWAKRYSGMQRLGALAPLLKRLPFKGLKKRGYLATSDPLSYKLATRYRFYPDEVGEGYPLRIEERDLLESMFAFDMKYFLADDVLVKVDRATMANSLEAREPFLDHFIVEHALSLPHEKKEHKRVLRELLRKYLPDRIVDRPKQGFSVPVKEWMDKELKSEVEHYLSKPSAIDEIVRVKPYHYLQKWYLYIFKRWEERWL